MKDSFNRLINTIRISLTTGCNLACYYCVDSSKQSKIYQLDSNFIDDFISDAIKLGITRVKLTGGEPLLHPNLIEIVQLLKKKDELEDVSLTTNGVLLKKNAAALFNAGLDRITISLDTLQPELYKKITGGNYLSNVLEGLDEVAMYEFKEIKINAVLLEGENDSEIFKIREYASKKKFDFQVINRMNLKANKSLFDSHTEKPPPCAVCSRLRLTADKVLLPCLFSDIELPLHIYSNYKEAISDAILCKPEAGRSNNRRSMLQIGG